MPLKYKQLLRILKDFGYDFDHQTGSHQIFRKNNCIETVPFHKEIATGTAKNILKSIADKNNTDISVIIKTYHIKL